MLRESVDLIFAVMISEIVIDDVNVGVVGSETTGSFFLIVFLSFLCLLGIATSAQGKDMLFEYVRRGI